MNWFITAIIIVIIGSSSCTNKPTPTSEATYIIHNAKIYTVNQDQPWAESIAILKDTILAIGTNNEISKFKGENTILLDADGKVILPGLIDAHAHPLLTAMMSSGYMAEPTESIDELITGIQIYANEHQNEQVIFGFGGFYMGQFELTKDLLDAIVPDRPVIMIESGGHGAWANSKTFDLLNIGADFPDPMPGYSFYRRDENSIPSGEIVEIAAYVYILDKLNVINPEIFKPSMLGVAEMMNEIGYTSIVDAGVFEPLDKEIYPLISEMAKENALNLRINASYAIKSMDKLQDVVPTLNAYQEYSSGNLQINTFKAWVDGTMEARSAAMDNDYLDVPGNKGTLAFYGEEFYSTLLDVAKNGYDIHLHAMGPRAIHEVLEGGKRVRNAGYQDITITNAHTQLVRDDDLDKFLKFNIIPNTSAVWHLYSGDAYIPSIGEENFNKIFRFQTLAESGVKVTIGTDFPASEGGILGANPFIQMQIAITRQMPLIFGDDKRIQPPVSEKMSIKNVVEAFTVNGAFQMNMQDEIGTLEVGKKADLILIDQNIFEIESDKISETKVLLTFFNGNITNDKIFDSKNLDQFTDVNFDLDICDNH